jgi:hypothetical protein
MRLPVVCTVVALGLVACHRSTAYLNADDLTTTLTSAGESPPCNDVEQRGGDVELAGSREPAPQPTGGTIEDGTYVLTSSTLHTKERPHGAKLVAMGKITMVVNGSTSQLVRSTADGRERRSTVSRVSTGTVTTLETLCASPTDPPRGPDATSKTGYASTRSSFQFITPGAAGTVVATYTKL